MVARKVNTQPILTRGSARRVGQPGADKCESPRVSSMAGFSVKTTPQLVVFIASLDCENACGVNLQLGNTSSIRSVLYIRRRSHGQNRTSARIPA